MKNPIKGLFNSFSKNANNTGTAATDLETSTTNPLVFVPASIMGGQLKELGDLRTSGNRYLVADRLYWDDERLYSAIELMAIMIEKSVGNPAINLYDEDATLTSDEESALTEAQQWAKRINLRKLFYNYAIDLWKYGDAVDVIKFNGSKGIVGLEPLPMHAISAIENLSQINIINPSGIRGDLISKPNYYIVDENLTTDLDQRIISKNRIFHISFNNRRSLVKDNLGRWTFNLWSMAPINSLVGIIAWKQQLIRNDILWRNRSIPREWHKLDLSMFDPSKYKGTYSEKLEAAKTDAQQAITDYNSSNARREADQGFVTGQSVDISWLEPKTTTYADPLPIIDQINGLLGGPSGTPSALLGGDTKGYTSLNKSTSFLALRAEIYSNVIQNKLEDLMKRHINIVRPGIPDEVVNRLYIKNRLILDSDRTELAKIVSILTTAKVFTPAEVRSIWGLDPLTEKQAQDLSEWLTSQKSISGTNRAISGEMASNPDNPQHGMVTGEKRRRDLVKRNVDNIL